LSWDLNKKPNAVGALGLWIICFKKNEKIVLARFSPLYAKGS
jgi:hypothetical protein